ncbi:hypothetical protein KR222_004590 [Zaprionus bogoriensis]|nr:hypothetical protein KR222_004590 [Zaprionus bogoriensis]
MQVSTTHTYVYLLFATLHLLAGKCNDKPTNTGPCKAAFPKWRFIKATRQCEPFIYGGCKGTKNMFDSEDECKKHCLS